MISKFKGVRDRYDPRDFRHGNVKIFDFDAVGVRFAKKEKCT